MAYYPGYVWPPPTNGVAYRPNPSTQSYPPQPYVHPQTVVPPSAGPLVDVWRELQRLTNLLDEEIQARNRQQLDYEKRVAELEQEVAELRQQLQRGVVAPSTDELPDPISTAAPMSTPETTSAVLPDYLIEFLEGPDILADCQSPEERHQREESLRGELYLFGGMSRNCSMGHDTVEKFDALNGLWDGVDTLPNDLSRVHLSAVGMTRGQVLLFSAFPSQGTSNKVYRFNTSSGSEGDVWMAARSSDRCRYLGAYCRLGDVVCVAGGYNCKPPSPFPFPPDLTRMNTLPTVEIFDVNHSTWNYLPSLPEATVKNALVAESAHVVYSLGGMAFGSRQHLEPTGSVHRFDLREGRWVTLASMNHCRAFFEAVPLNGHSMVALGGISASINASPRLQTAATHTMEMYDSRTNSWTPLPSMQSSRCLLTAHVMDGNQLYIIGGAPHISRKQDHIHPSGMDIYGIKQEKWIELGMLAGTSEQRFAHATCVI